MMRYMHFVKRYSMQKITIKIQPSLLLVLSVAVILIPLPWLLSWLIAAIIHEIFHFVALRLCGFTVTQICLNASGAAIESNMEPGIKMAICAVAGPLSGFCLLCMIHVIPRIAICGLFLSLCNLLPIFPLDGCRILVGVLSCIWEERVVRIILHYIECVTFALIIILVIYAIFRLNLGMIPLIALIVLFVKKKYLANNSLSRYNMNK